MAPPKPDPSQNSTELASLVKEIAVKTMKTAADVEDLKKGQAQIIATQLQHGMLLTSHDTALKRLEAVQTEHGVRLDRVEGKVDQVIEVMNENFGRLFALLKKGGPEE